MYELEAVIWTALGIVVFVVVCYVGTRAAAIAWFRTKLEYVRSVMKEGANNGEG
jgi:hypothetical protein